MIAALALGVLHGLAALALGLGFGLLGWAVTVRRVTRDAPLSVRLLGVATVALAAATGLFWLLALVRLFHLAVAVVVVAGSAAWTWRRATRAGHGWPELTADLAASGRALRHAFRGASGGVLAVPVLLAGVALVRGLVAPPLGWDGLTYHLLKAGRFVQSGALVTERAPDAWRYYEYFPLGGDLLWAWAMLPFRSALLLAPLDVLMWAITVLALYATARGLGAAPALAKVAAAAVGALPAVLAFLGTGYVDNATLAFFALGTVFLLRTVRGAVTEAPLAAAALGCMVGVRFTTSPLLALGGGLLAVALVRGSSSRGAAAKTLAACLALGLLGAPTYLRSWLEQGSPFHPIRLVVGGYTLSPGERMLYHTLDGVVDEYRDRNLHQPRWDSLFYASAEEGWYANPGPGAAVLVLTGLLGAWGLARRRRLLELGWLLAAAVLMLGALWTADMTVYRVSEWAHTVGRLLLPGFAALALLSAGAAGGRGEKLAFALLTLATLAGAAWAFPRGLSRAEIPGSLALLGVLAGTGVLAGLGAAWARRGGSPRAALALGTAVFALGLAGADRVRASQRYVLYEAAAVFPGGLYHLHPLNQYHAGAWPIWKALDGPRPVRIAAFGGWDGRGHNLYRFPLLGSRLQNLVLYVPFTRDGHLVDSPDMERIQAEADFRAWLSRLVAARVEAVVSLAPAIGIEAHWVEQAPEIFEPILRDKNGLITAYRFRPDRLPGSSGLPAAPPGAPR